MHSNDYCVIWSEKLVLNMIQVWFKLTGHCQKKRFCNVSDRSMPSDYYITNSEKWANS